MTGINIYAAQQSIKAYLVANIPWYVTSGAVPDAQTLVKVNGVVEPYVVLRFARLMPVSKGGSFGGARYDEYYSYVDALCIAETDDVANELASYTDSLIIGKTFDNVTEIAPNYGGGVYAVAGNSEHPLAFIAVSPYRYNTNVSGVGTGSLLP